MKNLDLLESIVLRGIQGKLEDEFLYKVAKGTVTADNISSFAECRHMAEQVYASWRRGWTR